jgi:hypothetical protein
MVMSHESHGRGTGPACTFRWCLNFTMTAPAAAPQFPSRVPLPQNPFDQANDTPSHDAYQSCLQNEIAAGNDENRLMYARCLGYLLIESPSENARDFIAHQIIDCIIQESSLDLLAAFYINHLFRLCMLFSTFPSMCPSSFSCQFDSIRVVRLYLPSIPVDLPLRCTVVYSVL